MHLLIKIIIFFLGRILMVYTVDIIMHFYVKNFRYTELFSWSPEIRYTRQVDCICQNMIYRVKPCRCVIFFHFQYLLGNLTRTAYVHNNILFISMYALQSYIKFLCVGWTSDWTNTHVCMLFSYKYMSIIYNMRVWLQVQAGLGTYYKNLHFIKFTRNSVTSNIIIIVIGVGYDIWILSLAFTLRFKS